MTKNISIAVAVIILVLAVFYFMQSSPAPEAVTTTTTNGEVDSTAATNSGTPSANVPSKGKGKLGSVFTTSSNSNYTCTIDTVDPKHPSNGTIFASSGRVRGDFHSKSADGNNVDSFIIDTGVHAYAWTQGSTTGIKAASGNLGAFPASITGGISLGSASDNIGWDCHPWIVDATKFTVPTYVKFQ